MNWFRTWLIRVTRKPKVHVWLSRVARELRLSADTEAALRSMRERYRVIIEEKNRMIIDLENALAERPVVYIHTTAPLRVVLPPPPQTTGPLRVESVRQRAREAQFKRQLNSQPSGTMARLDAQLRRQKQTTGQLGPITERLPAAPKKGAITRDLRGLLQDDTEDTKNVS